MRGLADRLDVKAASLYWHVRDRRELIELLAESILEHVRAPRANGWRAAVLTEAAALREVVDAQRDSARILLEIPEAVQRSDSYRRIKGQLESAGLQLSEAADVSRMVVAHAIAE